jgi:hypothetical protein
VSEGNLSPFSVRHSITLGDHFPRYQNSTLPLAEESVLHHSHLVSEVDKISPWKILCENVFNFLINRYVLKMNCSSLNPITYEVVFDLYVILHMMNDWILEEFDTTMIIRVNHCRPQLMRKYKNQ